MTQTKIVSVIIPIYNVEKYLDRCMESVVNQTYKNLEIILVNDGSTDESLSIIRKWEKLDDRIQVINKENGGLSDARNCGLKIARGDYICFVDSDDCIHLHMIERLLKLCEEYKVKVSACSYEMFREGDVPELIEEPFDDKVEKMTFDIYMKNYMSPRNIDMVVAWGKLYERSLFENIRFPLGKYCEDEFTTYKLVDAASGIVFSSAGYYKYFQRNDSIISQTNEKKPLNVLEAFLERDRYIKEKHAQLYHDWGQWVITQAYRQCVDCFVLKYKTDKAGAIFLEIVSNHEDIKKKLLCRIFIKYPAVVALIYRVKRKIFGRKKR